MFIIKIKLYPLNNYLFKSGITTYLIQTRITFKIILRNANPKSPAQTLFLISFLSGHWTRNFICSPIMIRIGSSHHWSVKIHRPKLLLLQLSRTPIERILQLFIRDGGVLRSSTRSSTKPFLLLSFFSVFLIPSGKTTWVPTKANTRTQNTADGLNLIRKKGSSSHTVSLFGETTSSSFTSIYFGFQDLGRIYKNILGMIQCKVFFPWNYYQINNSCF